VESYNFDDRNIHWNKLGDFEHLVYSILDIDEKNKITDVLFKFAANQQIVLHRHMAHNNTFVIQGEHRLYETNGEIKEIRPIGSYTSSPPSDEPHREGGGDQDVVVFFSIRGNDGILYEVLDNDLNLLATISMQDLIGLYKAQQENMEK
jgi:quercetin dioxygenase-like cupin family protein